MLASVDPVAKEAGKAHEGRASHLETPGPLDGDLSHHPQRQFRCAEANQPLMRTLQHFAPLTRASSSSVHATAYLFRDVEHEGDVIHALLLFGPGDRHQGKYALAVRSNIEIRQDAGIRERLLRPWPGSR